MKTPFLFSLMISALLLATGCKQVGSVEKPGVYFVSPADGETVQRQFQVVMGIRGMKVVPAGGVKEGTGHHHLIINGEPIPVGTVIPKSEKTIHFGKGQTETVLDLEPGSYTLTLQFGDGQHHSYGPQMASTIHITVVDK